ncbi:hypothetical protein GQ44DRAFT_207108 [Phaeosphaeriaceae sp. PMI808]|nr:hypothetical protein GQ44DRAFT_207108 [Phaeosphaeriaceae sp. PMI808]
MQANKSRSLARCIATGRFFSTRLGTARLNRKCKVFWRAAIQPCCIHIACAFTSLASTLETAVAHCTRALDKPDVPLVISSVKFTANIILDFLIISTFHVGSHAPTVNDQARIQLAVSLTAAVCGLVYFMLLSQRMIRQQHNDAESTKPNFKALVVLIRSGAMTFAESAVRNALYLWLISTIVAMGNDYATAWGVFSTIRWGLITVPVQVLELTSVTAAMARGSTSTKSGKQG